MNRTRAAIAATCVLVAVAGGVYGVWATLDAILTASPLTQFIVGASTAAAGTTMAYLSIKRE